MTILVVDAMPVVYQAYATVGHFCTKDKIPTGMAYGFLRSVRSWSEKFKARKTVICWDTPHPILKAAGVESYKADRVTTPEKQNMFDQMPALREMLSHTYYTQVEAPGHEADDLCATICRFYETTYGEDSVLATVDRDSFSAVSDLISVFHTVKDKKLIIPADVIEHFGVIPSLVPAVKAMLGDASDNIAPLVVGETAERFSEFLGQYKGTDPEQAILAFVERYQLPDDGVVDALLNLRITRLHDVPRDQWAVTKGSRDADALQAIFERWEFASMMKYIPQLTEENPTWPDKPKPAKKQKAA